MTYPITALPYDGPTQLEQLGTKQKFWFQDPEVGLILFKVGRPGTGENWAEKVCCEICELLDIPHADYGLATWGGLQGVVTVSFVPDDGRLVFGNELLSKFIDYDEGKRYQARQHTVRVVMYVIGDSNVSMPMGWSAPAQLKDAADVFVGYLMLDALVGNQDRHHENWGLISVPNQGVFFAPTFDHASSLGRNESDQVRKDILETRDAGRNIESYVSRARSALFLTPGDTKPLKTLEAFAEASKYRPHAANYWKNKLSYLKLEEIQRILDKIPDDQISEMARKFACKMMEINIKKILDL